MKRFIAIFGVALTVVLVMFVVARVFPEAQRGGPPGAAPTAAPVPPPNQSVPIVNNVPLIPFEIVPNFFKITPDQNFGETLAVALHGAPQGDGHDARVELDGQSVRLWLRPVAGGDARA